MDEGWIKIHRKVLSHPMYYAEPFTRMQAWFDLLLLASRLPNVLYIRGNRVEIKPGTVAKSKEYLCGRWRWSRGKVNRYLDMLENEGMIVQQKSRVITCISIPKFEYYQLDGTTESTTGSTTNKTTSRKSNGTTGRTPDSITDGELYKNIYNKKNNSAHARTREGVVDFVPPLEEEVNAYAVSHGISMDVAGFMDYYRANGWMAGKAPMKDWRAAARMWARKGLEKAEQTAREAARREEEREASRARARCRNATKTGKNGNNETTRTDKDGGRAGERERERMARNAEFERYIADTLQGDGQGGR